MSDLQPEPARSAIVADEVGIHFFVGDEDILIAWGEVASVSASRWPYEGNIHTRVFVDHYTGVDFRFHSGEVGYEQTTAQMEKRLIGFSRAQLEAVDVSGEDGEHIHDVWVRDETVQPFELQPEVVDPRDPTPQERADIEAARHASIASAERLLERPLQPEEVACIRVWFENGRIMGSTAQPLAQLLIERHNAKFPRK